MKLLQAWILLDEPHPKAKLYISIGLEKSNPLI